MPTFSPGPIFTVPDPVTGGAGAAVTVTEAFNAMWQNAQSKSEAGLSYTNNAIALADPAPALAGVTLDKSYVPPVAPLITPDNPASTEAMYNTQRDQLLNMITTQFRGFINEFFPRPELFEDAMDWCGRAVNNGGTGINAFVESQLWQRGRARILADSARAAKEAISVWANRRWPRPPGALAYQIVEIDLDAGRKLAEQSRDITVKSFDTEIENVRFAVTKLLDQRKVALDAAGDYIKTIMLGPQVAMQLTTGLANLRSEFSRSLVALYSAQSAALEPIVRLNIADANFQLEAQKANLGSQNASQDAKVKAAMAAAQMLGSMASAGINAINAQASISGQDSTSN